MLISEPSVGNTHVTYIQPNGIENLLTRKELKYSLSEKQISILTEVNGMPFTVALQFIFKSR